MKEKSSELWQKKRTVENGQRQPSSRAQSGEAPGFPRFPPGTPVDGEGPFPVGSGVNKVPVQGCPCEQRLTHGRGSSNGLDSSMAANPPAAAAARPLSFSERERSPAQPLTPGQNLEVSLPFQEKTSQLGECCQLNSSPSSLATSLVFLKYWSLLSCSNKWDKIPYEKEKKKS